MKQALIVSNKFSYGHLSGLMGWYSMLSKIGYKTSFYCDKEYKKQIDSTKYDFVEDIKEIDPLDLVVIFNISTKDGRLCTYLKHKNKKIKLIFIYHEPWRGLQEEKIRFKNDSINLVKQVGRHLFARKVIKKSDLIICPSDQGFHYYENNEMKLNKNCVVFPLVFFDDCKGLYLIKKEYISFISTASKDKAFDCFIDFVKYSSEINEKLKYQIVTQTDINNCLDERLIKLIKNERLYIKQGHGLSESEINSAYNNSLVTWLAYNSSTQSGVIAKAFMWGSPCVATPVGVFTQIVNGKNGILVSKPDKYKEILKAVEKIQHESENYFREARETFNYIYNSDNKIVDIKKILDMI